MHGTGAAAVLPPWAALVIPGDSILARTKDDPMLTRAALPALLHVGQDEIPFDDASRFADLLATSGSVSELPVRQGRGTSSPPILPYCMLRGQCMISPTTSGGAISLVNPCQTYPLITV